MANTVQAKKRSRQSEHRRVHNAAWRSMVRTYVKKVLEAVKRKDRDAAQTAYREASSVLDRARTKGVLHRNAAARYKDRLNERIRAL